MTHILPFRLMVLVAVLAAGCTIVAPPDPERPPPGPPALQEGYISGCLAGYVDSQRDGYQGYYAEDPLYSQRYQTDAEYRGGWNLGHAACIEEQRRAPRLLGGPQGR